MNQPGMIVILNGASSSGKTTLLGLLQERLEQPYLNAGIDKFIWMLPERWLERPFWDDVLGLATAAGTVGHRLFSGMHHAVAELSRAGNNVLADHVLVEPAWLAECAALFAGLPAYLIGVRCPLEVLVEREKSRRNRTLGQAAAQHPLVHAHGVYDFEVDTARFNPQECAQQVAEFLASSVEPRAFPILMKKFNPD